MELFIIKSRISGGLRWSEFIYYTPKEYEDILNYLVNELKLDINKEDKSDYGDNETIIFEFMMIDMELKYYEEEVKILVKYGANINHKNIDSETPLIRLTEKYYKEEGADSMLHTLLDLGVDYTYLCKFEDNKYIFKN